MQDSQGRWYRASFSSPCLGLRYAEDLGFVTDATGELDRFSSVLVDGERCGFQTFEKVPEAPAPSDPEQ